MMEEQTPPSTRDTTRLPGWRWAAPARFLAWLSLGMLAAVALAWLSLKTQWAGLSPLLLASLMVGGALGATLVALARWTGAGARRWMLAASFFLALITANMQHVFAYRAYVAGFHESVSSNPKAALAKTFNPDFGPAGYFGYMRAEARRGGYLWMWTIDGLLIVAATVGVMWWGLRRPHCAFCSRWYHVGRSGMLPGATAVATCAAAGVELPATAAAARFRLLECQCGCGPARLEVSWTTTDQRRQDTAVSLSPEQHAAFSAAAQGR